jgi:hypothetical protein
MCRPYIDTIIHKACNSAGLKIVPLLASSTFIAPYFHYAIQTRTLKLMQWYVTSVCRGSLYEKFGNKCVKILKFWRTERPVSLLTRKIHCLLYADDLVLLSESPQGLQNSLTKLSHYSDECGLQINIHKVGLRLSPCLTRRMIENYLSSKCYSLLHLRVYFHTYFL